MFILTKCKGQETLHYPDAEGKGNPLPFSEEEFLTKDQRKASEAEKLELEAQDISSIVWDLCSRSPHIQNASHGPLETPDDSQTPAPQTGRRYTWTLAPPAHEISSGIDSANIIQGKHLRQASLIKIKADPKNHKQAMSGRDGKRVPGTRRRVLIGVAGTAAAGAKYGYGCPFLCNF
ncbi:hypothetical protein PTTG_05978 [Puccinia triticina 1-1 BBBD Race 1]|uniref:Uncharacterized protein n=1 Tax=Puccinia triticina (isolate 1-1 / race 1 (BBBD)) TaxID=630390 RepID=A0A0C4EYS3_PUCT1|nr:hypothetical protein PTTG_05978 [Puccinia triticina 1-1 BBBD Race 1]